MRVREATKADIPRIVEMGERFFQASSFSDFSVYSEKHATKMARHLLEDEAGILLVTDDLSGMAGALVYPFYMTGSMTAQELFWWVEPEHRGVGRLLLDAMERAAKGKGAETLNMAALDSLDYERVAAVYRRAGFRPSEHYWIKEL